MLEIKFNSIPPSKKNSKQVFCRRGRAMVLPSKWYQKWHKETSLQLRGVEKIKGWNLYFDYYFKIPYNKDWSESKRPFDFSNKIESIQDLLVDNWIIEDDNYNYVSNVFIDYELVPYWEAEVILKISKI